MDLKQSQISENTLCKSASSIVLTFAYLNIVLAVPFSIFKQSIDVDWLLNFTVLEFLQLENQRHMVVFRWSLRLGLFQNQIDWVKFSVPHLTSSVPHQVQVRFKSGVPNSTMSRVV